MCCNRRDVFKHGRDKVAKDKRLSMLAWKYGLEDCRPKEERGRSESNLEPLPFLLGAHHSNYTCLARCLRAVLPWLLYHGTTCSTRTFEDRCKRVGSRGFALFQKVCFVRGLKVTPSRGLRVVALTVLCDPPSRPWCSWHRPLIAAMSILIIPIHRQS